MEGIRPTHSREEVEEGSALLKEVLVEWKRQVEGGGGESMSVAEKVEVLRELVRQNPTLQNNSFFQSVRAL